MLRKTTLVFFISFSPILLSAQDSLYQEALSLLLGARYDQAYQSFQQSATYYRTQNEGERYALSHLKMAECLMRSTQFDAALSHLQNIEGFIQNELAGNTYLQSESMKISGEILLNQGKSEQALEILLKAESTYPIDATLEKAEVFNLLGIVYWNNQNKALALQYHQEALNLRKLSLDEENIKIGDSYNNIGLIYLNDDAVQAKIYLNRALQIYESQLGTLNPKVAFVLLNLAQAASLQMRYSESEKYIDQVQQIWKNLYGSIDHPNIAFTTVVTGQIKTAQGALDQALIIQQSALQQYIRLFGPKHPDVANQHQIIGKVYRAKENYLEAIHSFQEAIYANIENQEFSSIYDHPAVENYFHADYLLSVLMDKASTLEALHFSLTLKQRELIASIQTLKLADQLISEIRKYRVSESDKLLLGATSRQIYESGCRLAYILGEQPFQSKKYNQYIFEFIEKSKAAVLQQAIQDTKAKSFAGIPDEMLSIEDSISTYLSYHQQKLAAGEEISYHKKQIFNYQTGYRDFIAQLEIDYPNYYNLKYQDESNDITSIQDKLSETECVIQYLIGEEQLYIVIISKNQIKAKNIAIDLDLTRNVTAFKNGLKYQVIAKTDSLARLLYNQLIPKLNKNISKLYLLPDGILNTLPFEALKDEKTGQFLIEQHRISYAFASNLIQPGSSTESSFSTAGLFAPISFQYEKESLPKLTATNEELLQLGVLMKAANIKVQSFRNEEANETTLKSESVKSFDLIHLATHGKVNQSSPELSRLYLKSDSINDGILFSGELYNLQLQANLVTLSACETGLGKIAQGEGIVGLSRALLYAGANNLIVSLWTVSDQATSELMKKFYEKLLLQENHSLDESLRQAKLAMLNSENYNAPYYWAPFILIGK